VSIELVTLLGLSSFIVLLVLGLPLAFVTGGTGIMLALILWGPDVLMLIVMRVFELMGSFIFVAVPMFVFMGGVLKESGVIEDVFEALHLWFGSLRGGLASITVLTCTLMATATGIIGASIVTMGLIALPGMLKRRYDKKIATGCIMAGGCLGILIPPSVLFIVFGVTAGVSVGRLFIAGLLPGLLLAGLYIAYITIRTFINPELAPAVPKEKRAKISLRQKLGYGKALILPSFLVVIVMGSIFAGVATPTEAAGVGSVGALLCALIRRRLTWRMLKEVTYETMRTTAMLTWLFFGASTFVGVYTLAGGARFMEDLIYGTGLGPWGIIILMQVILIILGMFIDWLGILLLTMPIFIPMIVEFGFDPVWFGVVFAVNMQISFLTPPFGLAIFYLKGVAPPGITVLDLIKSIWPFILLQLLGLVLIMRFSQLALWLPRLIFG
jgi:tripartite ATP-independent transporter DctM subunit